MPNRSKSSPADLPIGGITPFTTIDFPGKLAAVIYTQGCAWRCRYCHNAELRSFEDGTITWERTLEFLGRRQGLIDAVVFSGGEPTIHEALPAAVQNVRELGFAVGLHTAGFLPKKLREIIALFDWVGMDVKAPFDHYEKVTEVQGGGQAVRESAQIIIQSGVAHEFRTTYHPALLGEEDLLRLTNELTDLGAKTYALQMFHAEGCPDVSLTHTGALEVSAATLDRLSALFPGFTLRR